MTVRLRDILMGLKKKTGSWIDKALEHTHDHYLCYLPGHIGRFSTWVLKLFYSGIKIDETQTAIIKNLPDDAIIIYINKYRSFFEFLFYYTHLKEKGLPFPEIGLNYRILSFQPITRIFKSLLSTIDYLFKYRAWPDAYESEFIRRKLLNEKSGFLSLVGKRSFYRWFVKAKTHPLRYLIEMQRSSDRPIYIVPTLMFFDKRPIPANPSLTDIVFGTQQRPRAIRRLTTLFRTPEKIFVEISEPVNLKLFISQSEDFRFKTSEHLALLLRRNLLLQINRHRQSIVGPVLKSREELKETILTSDRLQQFINQHASKRQVSIQNVRKEATEYLEEIAAKYNIGLIKMAEAIITWLVKHMFDGISYNTDTLNRIKSMSKNGPIIFIPCHKSHIDYLILSYIVYRNNMPCPHIAAGKNLAFWPIGPFFRGGGAFFIRRTFKGAVLYAKVFSEYIHMLLTEGFNIEFFIEGGRSRTGKLLMPKLGLLSILLNACREGACDDLIFAPIYIGYDRVLEESAYLDEIEGGQKEPESLRQVISARKFLRKRYGRIYIQFHEPISLKAVLANEDTPLQEMTQKAFNTFCRNLGNRILNAIDDVTVVTPHALVASALLNCARKRFSYEHLMDHINTYLSYLYLRKAKLADTLFLDHVHAIEQVLDTYVERKLIEKNSAEHTDPAQTEYFSINPSKRPVLEYYKNNCISFFIPAAFTSLAILEKDAFQFSVADLHTGYGFLQEFFKNEFACNIDHAPEILVRHSIDAFINDAILTPHQILPDTYNISSEGLRKIKCYSRFLKPFFESYWIVLNYLRHHPENSVDPKERIKKIQILGNRMHQRKEIELNEALSKMNFTNAVLFFNNSGIRGSEDAEKIEFYAEKITSYLNLLQT